MYRESKKHSDLPLLGQNVVTYKITDFVFLAFISFAVAFRAS